ncbi:MAG: hypothetical protein HZB46_05420 [Solirubrobacterales bacterium]|nr:hypothetical protein [Solirubrobacterales bacterium]
MTVLTGIATAAGASVALNASYVMQHQALAGTPAVRVGHPIQAVRGLLASRRWVLGACCGYLGLVLNIAAMTLAPLWLVQATLATGLALASYLWARVARQPLRAGQRAALLLLGVGVLALGLAGAHGEAGVHTSVLPLAGFAGVFGGLAVIAVCRMGTAKAWRLGLAAGLSYGVTTVALAALVAAVRANATDAATVMLATAVGGTSVVGGFLSFQRGLQMGHIAPVVTLMTAAMNGVAMIGGLLLGGGLAVDWRTRALQSAGLIALCAASGMAATGLTRRSAAPNPAPSARPRDLVTGQKGPRFARP